MLEILSRTSHKPGNNPAAHAMQAPESPHHRVLLNSPTIIRGVVLLLTLLELFELLFYCFSGRLYKSTFFFWTSSRGQHCNNIYHFLHSIRLLSFLPFSTFWLWASTPLDIRLLGCNPSSIPRLGSGIFCLVRDNILAVSILTESDTTVMI